MNATTYTALLKDLQKLQKDLVAAQVARVRAEPALLAQLAEQHTAAEVGGQLDAWVGLAARRSTVRFLLRTVFVRVLEDLGALEPRRIRGEWGFAAFREVAPALGIRAYLDFCFRDLARDFPALFTPDAGELPLPGEDECRAVWNLWHHPNAAGEHYRWDGDGFDSRFLGDLYQDLDADIRKRYALLQTPHFVERYILDRTLTPALEVFDPAALREKDECFRLLDPTCGSGHFLVGGFHRITDLWQARGLEPWDACERALESVWGCDINPHAVDIARFRLLLEVVARTGETDLEHLAGLQLHLHALDSLVPWERGEQQQGLFPAEDRLAAYATVDERDENASFLGRDFHVVVGNPPYITPKDERKKEDYRAFWPDSCYMRYALSSPFAERLFALGAPGAWIGQITSNSFMKRQFGKKLVQTVFPRWDLFGVVDTSGAYIPGHGTPTVILFGRSQPPSSTEVWAVLGKRGEPKRPADPERGLVWSDIERAGQEPDDSSPFITVARMQRDTLHTHPWSLGGGAAVAIKEQMETVATKRLKDTAKRLGMMTILKQDDVYFGFPPGIAPHQLEVTPLVEGTFVRDYFIDDCNKVLFPYKADRPEQALDLVPTSTALSHFWAYKSLLRVRTSTGFRTVEDRGMMFYEFPFYFPETYLGFTITFAFVATHNHFVLDRGGKVFKQSAPVIKLPLQATEDDHLDVLGLLNSSTLGFWMRQVFHCKGAQGVSEGIKSEPWEQFHEYDSTKLQPAPLTEHDRGPRIALARALDTTARRRAAHLPAAVIAAGTWTPATVAEALAQARAHYRDLTHKMVALQEELDWLTYGSYGLLESLETLPPDAAEPLSPGHRPFEILFARADENAANDEKSAWWSRHGHERVTEIPAHYSPAHQARIQARMDAIEADPKLALLETAPFKRRWQLPDLEAEAKKAAESWLLDRLEDLFAPPGERSDHAAAGALATPRPYRLEEIATAWARDPRVPAVAGVFTGTGQNVDLSLVAESLLRGAALPDNPQRLYKPEGLRKLAQWKRTWAMQDMEDAGQPLRDPDTDAPLDAIPLPPQWKRPDFAHADFYKIRGKLNVPRERFVLFGELAPARYGWNGWRDRERALAQVEAFSTAEADPLAPLPPPSHDDPRRCGVTLGLWESLPDLRRWGDAGEHAELRALAQEVCQQRTCPCPVLEQWRAWADGTLEIGAHQTDDEAAPTTVEERAALSALLADFARTGATTAVLARRWTGSRARLALVLDDLVASGDASVTGRGSKRRYKGRRQQEGLFDA